MPSASPTLPAGTAPAAATAPGPVLARPLTPSEVVHLDRLRAWLQDDGVDVRDPAALDARWGTLLATHPADAPAPAGVAAAIGIAVGDVLVGSVPGATWMMCPGPDGATPGVVADGRVHMPVLAVLDAHARWRVRAPEWTVDYVRRAAVHLAAPLAGRTASGPTAVVSAAAVEATASAAAVEATASAADEQVADGGAPDGPAADAPAVPGFVGGAHVAADDAAAVGIDPVAPVWHDDLALPTSDDTGAIAVPVWSPDAPAASDTLAGDDAWPVDAVAGWTVEPAVPTSVATDADAPEPPSSEAFVLDTDAPAAYAPEPAASHAVVPEAYAPETYALETSSPLSAAADVDVPETYAPEPHSPEAALPESYAPEAYVPDAFEPAAPVPVVVPVLTEHVAVDPGAAELAVPELIIPELVRPDVVGDEATGHEPGTPAGAPAATSPAGDAASGADLAPLDPLSPAWRPPTLAPARPVWTPVQAEQPGAPAVPEADVVTSSTPVVAFAPVSTLTPEDLPHRPTARVQDLALRALEHALEHAVADPEGVAPFVLVREDEGFRITSFVHGSSGTREAREHARRCGLAAAAVGWTSPADATRPYPRVVIDASAAGEPGIRVAHAFVHDATGGREVGGPEVVGQAAPVL